MKRIMILLSAVLLALFPCILSAIAVFYYTMPMEDSSYNLSLLPQDGQEWEGSKGWTVFTSENGETTVLTPNGIGGYSGYDRSAASAGAPDQSGLYLLHAVRQSDEPLG